MKALRIWIVAFCLTLISGLFIIRKSLMFGSQFSFGFPSHWLTVTRSALSETPWHFNFLWNWFIIDLAIYVLLLTAIKVIYEKKLKPVSTRNIHRISFLLSNIALAICCWVFIIWMLLLDLGWANISKIGYDVYFGIWSWLRFLLGFTVALVTWFLIKNFKQTATPKCDINNHKKDS